MSSGFRYIYRELVSRKLALITVFLQYRNIPILCIALGQDVGSVKLRLISPYHARATSPINTSALGWSCSFRERIALYVYGLCKTEAREHLLMVTHGTHH
jgi:hypothetical protein